MCFRHILDTFWTRFAKMCLKCVRPHIVLQHRFADRPRRNKEILEMHKNRTTADCVGSYICRLNAVDHPSKLMCSGMPKQTTLKRMTIELVARSVASSRAKDRYRSFMCQSGRKQTKPISFLYLQTNILRRGDTQRHATDEPEFLALKYDSRIFGYSSNPLCGFSMMEQARLCSVWPTENWIGSSMNHIQGWMTV